MNVREEFEEWAIKEGFAVDIFMADQYPYRSTQAAWNAWQARQLIGLFFMRFKKW